MKYENDLSKIKVFIDDKEISHQEIDQWELKRMKKVYSFLGKKGFRLNYNLLKLEKIDEARYHLAMTKIRKTPNELRAMLKKRYK